VVASARARGHQVTLFNRGKTNPGLFPDLETLHGDRNADLSALAGRRWDAVIDTSGYTPKQVTRSAEQLRDGVSQYLFISTISVYADTSIIGMDETAPVGKLPDENVDEKSPGAYGPLKALCEQAVERALPGRVTTVRPGLIVGPNDPTDRFTYWPARMDRAGEVLAPGTRADPVQLIDVRDLADFVIRVIEIRTPGVYNALGPAETLAIGTMLDACARAAGKPAELRWVPAEILEREKVSPWQDMPVWVPPVGDSAGFARISNQRALAAGIRFRPIFETARDTLAWWRTLPEERRTHPRAGLSASREAEVLASLRHTSRAAAVAR
jgi:2'-hydroxyisoflavone reductase